ncbi:hypothetical protein SHO565_73490 [Streptomyces sp. HO565]
MLSRAAAPPSKRFPAVRPALPHSDANSPYAVSATAPCPPAVQRRVAYRVALVAALGTGTASGQQAPHRYQPPAVHRVTGCLKILAVTQPLPFRRKSPTATA